MNTLYFPIFDFLWIYSLKSSFPLLWRQCAVRAHQDGQRNGPGNEKLKISNDEDWIDLPWWLRCRWGAGRSWWTESRTSWRCSSAQNQSESLAVQTSRATRQHTHTAGIPKANLVFSRKIKAIVYLVETNNDKKIECWGRQRREEARLREEKSLFAVIPGETFVSPVQERDPEQDDGHQGEDDAAKLRRDSMDLIGKILTNYQKQDEGGCKSYAAKFAVSRLKGLGELRHGVDALSSDLGL